MKKTYRSFFCLLAVLLLSVSALPAASALFSERLYYYGTVEEISRAADGTVESVLVTAEGQETYEMVITERTQWQDHDEKTTSDPATLAVGEQICVVHDPASLYQESLYLLTVCRCTFHRDRGYCKQDFCWHRRPQKQKRKHQSHDIHLSFRYAGIRKLERIRLPQLFTIGAFHLPGKRTIQHYQSYYISIQRRNAKLFSTIFHTGSRNRHSHYKGNKGELGYDRKICTFSK